MDWIHRLHRAKRGLHGDVERESLRGADCSRGFVFEMGRFRPRPEAPQQRAVALGAVERWRLGLNLDGRQSGGPLLGGKWVVVAVVGVNTRLNQTQGTWVLIIMACIPDISAA